FPLPSLMERERYRERPSSLSPHCNSVALSGHKSCLRVQVSRYSDCSRCSWKYNCGRGEWYWFAFVYRVSIYSNLFLSRILYVDEDGVLAESLNSFEGDVLDGWK